MIRRAVPEEADAIAELYQCSFARLTYLPVLHSLDELKAWIGRRRAFRTCSTSGGRG